MDAIETARLRLVRMHDTAPDSQHVRWLHRLWSDKALMAWSLHGPTSTEQESREWLVELLDKFELLLYAVFVKDAVLSDASAGQPGELVGYLNLGHRDGGTLPPPPPPTILSPSGEPTAQIPASTAVDIRVLGYAYVPSAWGKGFATEAARALLDAYVASIAESKKEGGKAFYVEGTWDKKNPASGRVLTKLGMKEVGWKDEDEAVFLGGEWQEPGYWVYGMYV